MKRKLCKQCMLGINIAIDGTGGNLKVTEEILKVSRES